MTKKDGKRRSAYLLVNVYYNDMLQRLGVFKTLASGETN